MAGSGKALTEPLTFPVSISHSPLFPPLAGAWRFLLSPQCHGKSALFPGSRPTGLSLEVGTILPIPPIISTPGTKPKALVWAASLAESSLPAGGTSSSFQCHPKSPIWLDTLPSFTRHLLKENRDPHTSPPVLLMERHSSSSSGSNSSRGKGSPGGCIPEPPVLTLSTL